MTASDFAALLNARRIGEQKWQGRCPAHPDRSRSLSIGEGRDGRALLHCFAGCGLAQILASLRLTYRDLFAGPPPSPAKARLLASEGAMRDSEEQALNRRRRKTIWATVYMRDLVVVRIGHSVLIPRGALNALIDKGTIRAA